VNRPLIVGIAGGVIVLVAIAFTFFIDREPDRSVVEDRASISESVSSPRKLTPSSTLELGPVSSESQANKGEKTAPVSEAKAGKKANGAGGQPLQAATQSSNRSRVVAPPDANRASRQNKPTFDIVRVNPEGDTVIAGRAQPDSEVAVLRGDQIIGVVRADKRGEWVLVPEAPIASGEHTLTIVSEWPDGSKVSSDQSVVVVVPKRRNDVAGAETNASTGSLAIAIPKDASSAPIVLQTPGGIGDAELSLDAIDYGKMGRDLGLSGRATLGAEVRVYLDNKLIGRSMADERGRWKLKPDIDVPEGLYKMRVDRVDSAGKVIARVELPFSRARPVSELAEGTVVFVQPGNSLWRLARQSYGKGLRYTEIYEANKDQIRNPDLIYPGQVFIMPTIN